MVPAAFRTAAFQATRAKGVVLGVGVPEAVPQAMVVGAVAHPGIPQPTVVMGAPARVVGAVVPSFPSSSSSAGSVQGPLFSLPKSNPVATASSRSNAYGPTRSPHYKKNADHFSLRMNNIPHGVTSDELWEAYEYKGIHTISDVYIPRGMDFGFLRLANETEGLAALSTKIVLNGVTIHLEIATGNKRSSAEMAQVTPEEFHAKELQSKWYAQMRAEKDEKKKEEEDKYEQERESYKKERQMQHAQEAALKQQLEALQTDALAQLAAMPQHMLQQQGSNPWLMQQQMEAHQQQQPTEELLQQQQYLLHQMMAQAQAQEQSEPDSKRRRRDADY